VSFVVKEYSRPLAIYLQHMKFYFLILSIVCGLTAHALPTEKPQPLAGLKYKLLRLREKQNRQYSSNTTNHKLTASALALTLGVFGVHRLYLETEYTVPIAYTLTLGGGFGILPLSDIVAIWINPELEPYLKNPNFVMWIE